MTGEEAWDPKIPRSRGVIHATQTFGAHVLGEVQFHDGPRVIVCADCGAPVTDGLVFHLKPETYAVIYKNETFYLERHIGIKCGCAAKRGLSGQSVRP